MFLVPIEMEHDLILFFFQELIFRFFPKDRRNRRCQAISGWLINCREDIAPHLDGVLQFFKIRLLGNSCFSICF